MSVRTTHPYQGVRPRRGVAGYVGAAADAQDDPDPIFPGRPVSLPVGANSPIHAGADDVTNAFSGGGSTPTLAEVLGEGNDPAGAITAAGDVNGSGGTLLIGPQSDHSGKVVLEGGSGAIAQPGGAAEIRGGFGDNGNDAAAYINVSGGGWEGTGIPGGVTIHSNGSHGSFGQVGAWKDGYFAWTNPLSTGAGAPGGTFTTPLYVDTTDRHLYAWDGSAYVLVSDYA